MSGRKKLDQLIEELEKTIKTYELTGNGRMRHVAMMRDAAERLKEMQKALEPLSFFDVGDPDTTQKAWEIRYQDRLKDWIDFDDIRNARLALDIESDAEPGSPEL